jgi:phytoene dehydrogenase-like protein
MDGSCFNVRAARDGLKVLLRPRLARDTYKIGDGFWLCSAATPPGGGVHGLCGWHAAQSVLREPR